MFKKNRDLKKTICVAVCFVVVSLLSGLIGYKTHKCNCKVKKEKSIKFFQFNKMFGKKFSNEESVVLKKFKQTNNSCLSSSLDEKQQEILQNIVNEVLELAKNNDKVSYKFNSLKSVKNNKKEGFVVIKKARKCLKQTNKSLTKQEKKILKGAIKKQSIGDNIKLYNGIK